MQSTVCTLVVLVRYSNLHLYHVFLPGEKLYYTCLCVYINLIKCYKFVVKWFANRKQAEKKIEQQKIWYIFLNICSSGIHKDITQCKKNTWDLPTVCTQGSEGYSKNGDAISWRTDWSKGSGFIFVDLCSANLTWSRLSSQNSLVY